MRSSISLIALLLAPAALVFAAPAPVPATPALPTQLRISLDTLFDGLANIAGDDDDICPDLVVRCIKDDDITKVVGDIGEQSFCKKGVTCRQCHSKKNSAECNLKYLKECAGKCSGQGSPI